MESDTRWSYGAPPQGNANFAWLQHILSHLSQTGRAGVVLANGSMSSAQGGEGEIRRRMVESDVVECMVALPPQLFFNTQIPELFFNTQIPACLWFLSRDKSAANGQTDRRGQTLFIDARKLGRLESRVFRTFAEADVARIAGAYHRWRGSERDGLGAGAYADEAGFCQSATRDEIAAHGWILTPGRYVAAEIVEQSEAEFAEQMADLTETLAAQFAQSASGQQKIKANLAQLGWEI